MHRQQGLEVCPHCSGIHTSYPFDCREKGKPWPKPNDYFSDEEIAEAKEKFPKSGRIHKLIARLEAAEAVIRDMEPPLRMMKMPVYEAWLRSKGEK